MRRQHYLKGSQKTELPSHMIFVDTETKGIQYDNDTEHHYLWFGWACYRRTRNSQGNTHTSERWTRFTTADDFWEWVTNCSVSRSRTWIFAHNWNFDAGILATSEILLRSGYRLLKYINDKPPFIVEFRNASSTLRLVDTLNYFAGSLASIGESIGLGKLGFPTEEDSQETWDTYCKQDVRVIIKAVSDFIEFISSYDLGNFQATLASQAFTAFRHRFMDHKIHIHDKVDICQLERNGYYGGRSECFFIGEVQGPLYYLDVNSMYPFVMLQNEYPSAIHHISRVDCLEDVYEFLQTYQAVAECMIETPDPIYPLRIDKRLCFPIGKFSCTLTTPEILHAMENGHLMHVGKIAYYEHAPHFRRFVETLYDLRQGFKQDNNETFSYMTKIMLNSLYGKFGQNGVKWTEINDDREPFEGITYERETPDSPILKLRYRLGRVQIHERKGESDNSFPAISAHVTANGRLLLWDLIRTAGTNNVFYTDTDSLIVNEQGYQNLASVLDADKLGGLKIEATGDSATFWGPKDYRFHNIERHKGIKKNATKLSNDTWEQDQFRSWDSMLSEGLDGYIPIKRVRKTLHRIYRKGNPTSSGWVQPFELAEVLNWHSIMNIQT